MMCKMCQKVKRINSHGLCWSCTALLAIGQAKDITMSPSISREKTLERFGYDPLYLSHQSGMKVVKICPQCGSEKNFRKQVANKHEWCIRCRGRENNKKYSDARRIYPTIRERLRKNSERAYARPLGYLGTILRTGLRLAYKASGVGKPRGCFGLLGYSPIEFQNHINCCLDNGCIICGNNIDGKWHLAHIKPRSWAKTETDLIRLFQLDNLGVAHPSCNIRWGNKEVINKNHN